MARPAKPTRINWGNAGVEPGGAKKSTGHSTSDLDKPTANQFNWFWEILTRIQDWLFGAVDFNIIIDSDTDEGNYATLAAYIADSPAAGDRVLVKVDQTSAVQVIIPNGITVKFLKGTKITFTANLANALEVGDDTTIAGELLAEFTHTGTTVDAISFNGNRSSIDVLHIHNSSTGTITNAIEIQSGKLSNTAMSFIRNTGGGTITNNLVDSSTNDTNYIHALLSASVERSDGAQTFGDGFALDLGSDADGDIYQRDTGKITRLAAGLGLLVKDSVGGLLKWTGAAAGDIYYNDGSDVQRLAKPATDGFVLGQSSGIPAWSNKYARAYFAGQLGSDDAWVTISGSDASDIDWSGKRVLVMGSVDASDITLEATFNIDGTDIGAIVVLTDDTSRNISTSADPLNLRFNSSTEVLEIQRPTGSYLATDYISFTVISVT